MEVEVTLGRKETAIKEANMTFETTHIGFGGAISPVVEPEPQRPRRPIQIPDSIAVVNAPADDDELIATIRERRRLQLAVTDLADDVERQKRLIHVLSQKLVNLSSENVVQQVADERTRLQDTTHQLDQAKARLFEFNEQHLSDAEIARRQEEARKAANEAQKEPWKATFLPTLKLWYALTVLDSQRDRMAEKIARSGASIKGLTLPDMLVSIRTTPIAAPLVQPAHFIGFREAQIRKMIEAYAPGALNGLDSPAAALEEVIRIMGETKTDDDSGDDEAVTQPAPDEAGATASQQLLEQIRQQYATHLEQQTPAQG